MLQQRLGKYDDVCVSCICVCVCVLFFLAHSLSLFSPPTPPNLRMKTHDYLSLDHACTTYIHTFTRLRLTYYLLSSILTLTRLT